jgi:phosphoglucosamine mutase
MLRNVRLERGASADAVLELDIVRQVIKACEQRLVGRGRLLIRKSGTEPLIRVMAEGDDAVEVDDVVSQIIDTIKKAAA